MKGTLLLLPCHMGDSNADMTAVPALLELIHSTEHFIVENVKTARRWLRTLDREIPIDPLTFHTLNKHTSPHDLEGFLSVAKQGGTVALLSEAGLPCIADPGAQVVEIAHRLNIKVTPIPGPSSILLALIASGFNGQNFCFHGYLAKDQGERIRQIKELESNSRRQTQIFMETPFRAQHVFTDLLNECKESTRLCLASDITLKTEMIKTQEIGKWKKRRPDLKKRLCVFLLG